VGWGVVRPGRSSYLTTLGTFAEHIIGPVSQELVSMFAQGAWGRCAPAAAWVEHEKQEAKKRQSELNGKTLLQETFPEATAGQSRDKVGERVGTSGQGGRIRGVSKCLSLRLLDRSVLHVQNSSKLGILCK